MSWNPLRLAWGLWALLLTLPLVLFAALPILALPGLQSRRAAAGAAFRAYLRLCGLPVRLLGLERLPNAACIIVANLFVDLLYAWIDPRIRLT